MIGLADDIARSMSAVSARIAVVPGRNAIGIELPNTDREFVHLRELLASAELDKAPGALTLALGKDIAGAPVVADLSRMPHLLIAGTTGSGKSVGRQRHDPVAALSAPAGRVQVHHDRSQGAGAVGV